MLLYSVQPPEVVWSESETPAPTVLEIPGNRRLIVERDPAGGWRVVRLSSTEPRDYLDPRWRPGQRLFSQRQS